MYHLIPSPSLTISRASSALRCNDIHSLALSILFRLRIIDFLVHSVPCGYCCWISLCVHSIYFPHDPLERMSVEHVIPVVRYPRPSHLILTILHVYRPPSLFPPASRSIYMYMYISHRRRTPPLFGPCIHGTAVLQRYPLLLSLPHSVYPPRLLPPPSYKG